VPDNEVPRLRTVKDIHRMLLSGDKHTSLSLCALRRLVHIGAVKTVDIGRKRLINFDSLIEYLNNPTVATPSPQLGTIRRVD
jgi:hypothetical protein